MQLTRRIGLFTTLAASLGLLLGPTAPADATTATATLSAGSLAFITAPPAVSFSATLDGSDQTVSTTQALDVSDATGSGSGWNMTATSTTFATTSPVHTMSTSATTVGSSPTVACDAGSSCTLASNSVTYPYTLPAASSAPTATKMFNAAANTGLGNETVTPTWKLAVPASTFAGTYSSTWTLSLVSGP
jgi:hypothetical protein